MAAGTIWTLGACTYRGTDKRAVRRRHLVARWRSLRRRRATRRRYAASRWLVVHLDLVGSRRQGTTPRVTTTVGPTTHRPRTATHAAPLTPEVAVNRPSSDSSTATSSWPRTRPSSGYPP